MSDDARIGPIPVVRTADPVLRVTDAGSGDEYELFRCNACKALVLRDDVRDHLTWHDRLVHTPAATEHVTD